MTSSAEEEIFEASFSRRSSMIQKAPDVATDQPSRPFHSHLADEEVPADTQDDDVESSIVFIVV